MLFLYSRYNVWINNTTYINKKLVLLFWTSLAVILTILVYIIGTMIDTYLEAITWYSTYIIVPFIISYPLYMIFVLVHIVQSLIIVVRDK